MDTKFQKMSQAWKLRQDYSHGLAGTKIHNTWRAMRFTIKGKKIGICDDWLKFNNFVLDMLPSYNDGMIINRMDKTKPFSKENCLWVTKDSLTKRPISLLSYKGETLSLIDFCLKYDLNYNGVRQRYHKGKNYTPEQILFGKNITKKHPVRDYLISNARAKASKMVSQYKLKDDKKGFGICDLDIDFMINDIFNKSCVYCGVKENIGCDRVDNNKGHAKDNVVPCCYRCNSVRGNHFTHNQFLIIGVFIRDNIDKG